MHPRLVLAVLAVLALPGALRAQASAGEAGQAVARQRHDTSTAAVRAFPRPAGWQTRFDDADAADSALAFADMPPGWHITTGPSGILYDPARTATGDFEVRAELHLFPGQRDEGFGVFVGGRDLAGAGQQYSYFLLRRDGRFTVRRREGAAARDLVPWTANAAIAPHDKAAGTVRHELGVRAAADSVHFSVNGTRVASLPRAAVAPDGVVGLRVNHALNLHVTSLEVKTP
jgi:hypothetical protein